MLLSAPSLAVEPSPRERDEHLSSSKLQKLVKKQASTSAVKIVGREVFSPRSTGAACISWKRHFAALKMHVLYIHVVHVCVCVCVTETRVHIIVIHTSYGQRERERRTYPGLHSRMCLPN